MLRARRIATGQCRQTCLTFNGACFRRIRAKLFAGKHFKNTSDSISASKSWKGEAEAIWVNGFENWVCALVWDGSRRDSMLTCRVSTLIHWHDTHDLSWRSTTHLSYRKQRKHCLGLLHVRSATSCLASSLFSCSHCYRLPFWSTHVYHRPLTPTLVRNLRWNRRRGCQISRLIWWLRWLWLLQVVEGYWCGHGIRDLRDTRTLLAADKWVCDISSLMYWSQLHHIPHNDVLNFICSGQEWWVVNSCRVNIQPIVFYSLECSCLSSREYRKGGWCSWPCPGVFISNLRLLEHVEP